MAFVESEVGVELRVKSLKFRT